MFPLGRSDGIRRERGRDEWREDVTAEAEIRVRVKGGHQPSRAGRL